MFFYFKRRQSYARCYIIIKAISINKKTRNCSFMFSSQTGKYFFIIIL